jgi:hypothetical protein
MFQVNDRVWIVKDCGDGQDEKYIGKAGYIRVLDGEGYAEVELEGKGPYTYLFALYQLTLAPQPGTYAFTAEMMSQSIPDYDWDTWKDEMKEGY